MTGRGVQSDQVSSHSTRQERVRCREFSAHSPASVLTQRQSGEFPVSAQRGQEWRSHKTQLRDRQGRNWGTENWRNERQRGDRREVN